MPGVVAMSGRVQKFAFRSGVGIGPRDAFMMVFVPVTLLAWVTWLPLVWVRLVGWVPVYARFRMRCIVIDEDARSLSVRNFWVTRVIAFDDVSGVEWRSRYFCPGSAVDGHMRGVRRANMLVSGLRVV